MGTLTHAEIVTEALELAGNTGLTTRAQTWLGIVLRELSERFTFPQQETIKAIYTLASGVGSLTIGGAGADVFPAVSVRGVKRILLATNSTQTDWVELEPVPATSPDPTMNNNAAKSGRPLWWIAEPFRDGFTISFAPVPNKAYRLMIIVDARMTGTSVYSASTVNLYPNDLTVVQGVYAFALKHQQDERAPMEWSEFERMAKNDRVRYGGQNPDNKKLRLAANTFARKGARGGNPWDWMGPK